MAKESEIKGALIPKQQKNRYEIRFLFDSNDEDEENSKKWEVEKTTEKCIALS